MNREQGLGNERVYCSSLGGGFVVRIRKDKKKEKVPANRETGRAGRAYGKTADDGRVQVRETREREREQGKTETTRRKRVGREGNRIPRSKEERWNRRAAMLQGDG